MTPATAGEVPKKQGLFAMVASLPTLVRTLVEQEIELIKAELIAKLKAVGVGVGLIAIASVVTLLLLGVLLVWAFLGLAAVLPLWAAGLIMSLSLVVVIVALVGIGVARIRSVKTLVPERSRDSLKLDAEIIKGTAKGTAR